MKNSGNSAGESRYINGIFGYVYWYVNGIFGYIYWYVNGIFGYIKKKIGYI